MAWSFGARAAHLALLAPLWALSGCWVGLPHAVNRPPIKLKIVDSATKRPLPGIRVGYALETVILRGRLLGLIPAPEPTIAFRIARTAEAVTDGEGLASVATTGFRLPGNEQVVRELVFVNLGLARDHEAVRAATESHRSYCDYAPSHCDAVLDDVVLMHELLLEDVATRVAVFRSADMSHEGAVLVDDGALEGWGDADDCYRIQRDVGPALSRGEALVVALEPAIDEGGLRDRISSLERALASGTGDRAAALREVAAALRTLRLREAGDPARARPYLVREREAYAALIAIETTDPRWTWKLVETWDQHHGDVDPASIAPLQDGVARFPQDHALRHELGVRLCRRSSRAEGLEQLVEAARLVPPGAKGKHGTYYLNIDAQTYCGDCADGTCRVQQVFMERKLSGYR